MEATQLRTEVVGVLKSSKPPKGNITRLERKTILDIKSEKLIMILPADKGKAVVVMGTSDYEQKVISLLADEKTYEKLKKDATLVYKKKLIDILSRLKEENKITEGQYRYLYPHRRRYRGCTVRRKYTNLVIPCDR